MLASLTARAMAFLYVAPEYQNGHPLEHHGYNRLVPLDRYRRPDVEASELTVVGETNTDNPEWQWLDLQEGQILCLVAVS
jgi:hypothetical protein